MVACEGIAAGGWCLVWEGIRDRVVSTRDAEATLKDNPAPYLLHVAGYGILARVLTICSLMQTCGLRW
jgi:hypothetical protein